LVPSADWCAGDRLEEVPPYTEAAYPASRKIEFKGLPDCRDFTICIFREEIRIGHVDELWNDSR
jgi:hypothetical protein